MFTNKFIAEIVQKKGGRSFVLPDKIPILKHTGISSLQGKHNFLCISSFAADEPVGEIISAFNELDSSYRCYITGNYKKLHTSVIGSASNNIIFTGFLDEQEFINLTYSVDAVIVLTDVDYTMLCGCYEAVSACKPLITSNKSVLRDYFEGALFIDNSKEAIKHAVKTISGNIDHYKNLIVKLKDTLVPAWNEKSRHLEEIIKNMEKGIS